MSDTSGISSWGVGASCAGRSSRAPSGRGSVRSPVRARPRPAAHAIAFVACQGRRSAGHQYGRRDDRDNCRGAPPSRPRRATYSGRQAPSHPACPGFHTTATQSNQDLANFTMCDTDVSSSATLQQKPPFLQPPTKGTVLVAFRTACAVRRLARDCRSHHHHHRRHPRTAAGQATKPTAQRQLRARPRGLGVAGRSDSRCGRQSSSPGRRLGEGHREWGRASSP